MSIFDFFTEWFGSGSSDTDSDSDCDINPATGLPMMDSCFDIAGNVFGTNSDDDMFLASSSFDDQFDSLNSYSSFDDDF
ncbi:hypothetical protein KFV02_04060 [Desulfohalobiaceae bacterium Ax17]|uniref:hypothetical protein n=1 Tax=Desulfovulcanus ferrireducens TaxID=2831190 RepID=UPI00207BC354|nr:hypothetical protein [Desulfovulcanus ferrireducens]MBT8763101.1 hypothetical protein [Desulfovulcanus ferrireducens]